jgi:hypothetical protein
MSPHPQQHGAAHAQRRTAAARTQQWWSGGGQRAAATGSRLQLLRLGPLLPAAACCPWEVTRPHSDAL